LREKQNTTCFYSLLVHSSFHLLLLYLASGNRQVLIVSDEHIFLRDSSLQKLWKLSLADLSQTIERRKNELIFRPLNGKSESLVIPDANQLESLFADLSTLLNQRKGSRTV
jgi:hypothetical protein